MAQYIPDCEVSVMEGGAAYGIPVKSPIMWFTAMSDLSLAASGNVSGHYDPETGRARGKSILRR